MTVSSRLVSKAGRRLLGVARAARPKLSTFASAGNGDTYVRDTLGSALVGWWDANDASCLFTTRFQASSAGNGNAVGRLRDKSGNQKHADQASAASKPSRSDAAINGLTGLAFNGTSCLVSPTVSLASTAAAEFWVVCKADNLTPVDVVVSYGTSSAANVLVLFNNSSNTTSGYVSDFGTSSEVRSTEAIGVTTAAVWRIIVNTALASNEIHIYKDGLLVSSTRPANGNGTTGNLGTGTVQIGAAGTSNVFQDGLSGAFGELFIVNRLCTDTEAELLQVYLEEKWSTSAAAYFSPIDVTGLEFWLDATVGVNLDGSNVTEWVDRVVSAQFIMTGSGESPTSVTGVNDRAAIRFDDIKSALESDTNFPHAKVMYAYVALRPTTDSDPGEFRRLLVSAQSGSQVQPIFNLYEGYPGIMWGSGSTNKITSSHYLSTTVPSIVRFSCFFSSSVNVRVNNNADERVATAQIVTSSWGSLGNTSQPLGADVYAVFVVHMATGSTISADNDAGIMAWLNARVNAY